MMNENENEKSPDRTVRALVTHSLDEDYSSKYQLAMSRTSGVQGDGL